MHKKHFDERVTFRLTSFDRERILHRAKADGISMTHLLRAIVTGYLEWCRKNNLV